jgi:hypothetical protein
VFKVAPTKYVVCGQRGADAMKRYQLLDSNTERKEYALNARCSGSTWVALLRCSS